MIQPLEKEAFVGRALQAAKNLVSRKKEPTLSVNQNQGGAGHTPAPSKKKPGFISRGMSAIRNAVSGTPSPTPPPINNGMKSQDRVKNNESGKTSSGGEAYQNLKAPKKPKLTVKKDGEKLGRGDARGGIHRLLEQQQNSHAAQMLAQREKHDADKKSFKNKAIAGAVGTAAVAGAMGYAAGKGSRGGEEQDDDNSNYKKVFFRRR